MRKIVLSVSVLAVAALFTARAGAQALPTASTRGTFQAGAGYTIVSPDYGQKKITGFTGFADYDIGMHFGIEADAHIANLSTPTDIAENSYLAGPRFIYPYRHFSLYGKVLAGYGDFKVLETQDNQGIYSGYYFAYALGGGLEYRASEHIVIRAIDVESQKWPSFGKNGLTPLVATFGVAYHFR